MTVSISKVRSAHPIDMTTYDVIGNHSGGGKGKIDTVVPKVLRNS